MYMVTVEEQIAAEMLFIDQSVPDLHSAYSSMVVWDKIDIRFQSIWSCAPLMDSAFGSRVEMSDG